MLEELAASFWFRSLLPLGVGLLYELGTRYANKGESSFGQGDWFIALPAMGAAIVALPPLTALRASNIHASNHGDPNEAIALAGLMLAALVIAAFIVATLDRRVLTPRRRRGKFLNSVLLTWVPNAVGIMIAVAFLGIVGQ